MSTFESLKARAKKHDVIVTDRGDGTCSVLSEYPVLSDFPDLYPEALEVVEVMTLAGLTSFIQGMEDSARRGKEEAKLEYPFSA